MHQTDLQIKVCEYYINITFPDWMIVENIIPTTEAQPRLVIIFRGMLFSSTTQSGTVIFILLYRTLDFLFSTVLGLPW